MCTVWRRLKDSRYGALLAVAPRAAARVLLGRCNTLQHTETQCNTLQRIAMPALNASARVFWASCNTLQHTVTQCNAL